MQKDCNAWLAISLSIEFSIGVVGNRKYRVGEEKRKYFLSFKCLLVSLFSCFVCSCEGIGLRAKFAYLKNSSTFAMSNNERGWTKT